MKAIWLAVISVLMCLLCMGCTIDYSTSVVTSTPTVTPIAFTQSQAIALVLKEQSDFPSDPNKPIIRQENNGGPYGVKLPVQYSTKAEKINDTTYIVTLTIEPVSNKKIKGYWKYKVTPESVVLIESKNLPKYY